MEKSKIFNEKFRYNGFVVDTWNLKPGQWIEYEFSGGVREEMLITAVDSNVPAAGYICPVYVVKFPEETEMLNWISTTFDTELVRVISELTAPT